MKKKHHHKNQYTSVFRAADAMAAGKLPKKRDAVEYIVHLRETLGYCIKQNVGYIEELEKRGWVPFWKKKGRWTTASGGQQQSSSCDVVPSPPSSPPFSPFPSPSSLLEGDGQVSTDGSGTLTIRGGKGRKGRRKR